MRLQFLHLLKNYGGGMVAGCFLLLCSCSDREDSRDEPMDGGPCDYRTVVSPAIVTQIAALDPENFRLYFTTAPTDSFSYAFSAHAAQQEYGISLTDIKIGDTFQVERNIPTQGYCKESFEVQLKKYSAASR